MCEMEGIRGEHEQIERPESLKEEERVTIKNTWAKVYENKKVAGVAVLIRYSSLSICLSVLYLSLSDFLFQICFSCLTGRIAPLKGSLVCLYKARTITHPK